MEISLLFIHFLYLGTSVIYVVRNRTYWSSSDSSSKPKPGNTTRTNTIKLFWLYSVALSSLPLLLVVSAGLPSAIRQRWWRIHWTLFGRLLKSLFELFATVIMTGMSLFFRQQLLWQVKYNAATKTAIWIIQGSSFQYERHSKMPFSVIHAPLMISVSDGLFRLRSAKTLHGCLCLTFSLICLF